MSTYLEICQDVARESGTVPTIGQPDTITGLSGRLLRIANWVNDAHKDIQRMYETWRWLNADFSGQTIASTQNYNAASMGISSRFSRWVTRGQRERDTFSIYLTSEGQEREQFLEFIEWENFRFTVMVGGNATREGKPIYVSINDQRELVFYPTPDAAYTVRGRYYKAPQTLTVDADTPEMPEEFHDIIKWRALMLMGLFDEAFEQYAGWTQEYNRMLDQLTDSQLPRLMTPGPLA